MEMHLSNKLSWRKINFCCFCLSLRDGQFSHYLVVRWLFVCHWIRKTFDGQSCKNSIIIYYYRLYNFHSLIINIQNKHIDDAFIRIWREKTESEVTFHVPCCHTGGWNYQRHFSQSFEVREHCSKGCDQNLTRMPDFSILQVLASLGGNKVVYAGNCHFCAGL